MQNERVSKLATGRARNRCPMGLQDARMCSTVQQATRGRKYSHVFSGDSAPVILPLQCHAQRVRGEPAWGVHGTRHLPAALLPMLRCIARTAQ